MQRLDIKELLDTYLFARDAKQLLVEGPIMEQTNWYFEFCDYIERKLKGHQIDEIERASKEAERKSKLNSTKKPKRGKR